jgi:TIR domain
MALLTESVVRARARAETTLQKSVSTILREHVVDQASIGSHEIFMSHAYADREIVLGVALKIEDYGYSVYIDWRDDPSLDRSTVSPNTAAKLRARIKASRCLFYATTRNAIGSKWMPWELGFKDGHNTRVAIVPVAQFSTTTYVGREYLGIYPYIDEADDEMSIERLWVNRSRTRYVALDEWLTGEEPTERG